MTFWKGYRVDHVQNGPWYFWTLWGARRYRNRCKPYELTRLYWWMDKRWVEMS